MIITCNQNTSSYTTEKSHTSAFLKEFESLVFNMKTGAPGRSTYGSYATPLPPPWFDTTYFHLKNLVLSNC